MGDNPGIQPRRPTTRDRLDGMGGAAVGHGDGTSPGSADASRGEGPNGPVQPRRTLPGDAIPPGIDPALGCGNSEALRITATGGGPGPLVVQPRGRSPRFGELGRHPSLAG